MIDLILLVLVLLGLLWGWFKGGMRVLAGLGALIIAFQMALYYSRFWSGPMLNLLPPADTPGKLMTLINMFIEPDVLAIRVVQVILFIIIFVLTRWLINKLASLLTGLLGGSILGVLNRVFGAVMGGLIIALLIVLIHKEALPFIGNMGFDMAFLAQEFLEQSKFVLPLVYAVPNMLGI